MGVPSVIGAIIVISALFWLFKEAAMHIIAGLLLLGALFSVISFIFG